MDDIWRLFFKSNFVVTFLSNDNKHLCFYSHYFEQILINRGRLVRTLRHPVQVRNPLQHFVTLSFSRKELQLAARNPNWSTTPCKMFKNAARIHSKLLHIGGGGRFFHTQPEDVPPTSVARSYNVKFIVQPIIINKRISSVQKSQNLLFCPVYNRYVIYYCHCT